MAFAKNVFLVRCLQRKISRSLKPVWFLRRFDDTTRQHAPEPSSFLWGEKSNLWVLSRVLSCVQNFLWISSPYPRESHIFFWRRFQYCTIAMHRTFMLFHSFWTGMQNTNQATTSLRVRKNRAERRSSFPVFFIKWNLPRNVAKGTFRTENDDYRIGNQSQDHHQYQFSCTLLSPWTVIIRGIIAVSFCPCF